MTEESRSLYVKREKVQNRWITGFFQRLRVITIWATLSIYFIGPWISWGNRQAILFDLPNRKFNIFSITFWPQDFFLLSWLLIILALSLIFITTLAGRLWCGYTCPQTVWTRFFMWIEYITEGDRNMRLKRDRDPWHVGTIARRTTKHILWLLLAFITGFTFVGYFISIEHLLLQLLKATINFWPLFWIVFFTIATYINAGWMREQVCIHMCPYARFQSVMLDNNSLVISYDYNRGEPRGKHKHNVDASKLGDCIDCNMCVQVCPTGIDIRDGLQVPCIGCAACVDACDSVMEKLDLPKGLVRYSTENALEKKKTNILRPRLIANGIILLVMATISAYTLINRIPLRLDITRERNNLYRTTVSGKIENTYFLKIMNMSQRPRVFAIDLNAKKAIHYLGPKYIIIPAEKIKVVPVSLQAAPSELSHFIYTVAFTVTAKHDKKVTVTTQNRFFGPTPQKDAYE